MIRISGKRMVFATLLAILFVLCTAVAIVLMLPNSTALADTFSHSYEEGHKSEDGWTALTAQLVDATEYGESISKTAGEIVGSATDGQATYYYLDEDVTLETNNITITGNVVLCLNGNMLTGNSNGSVITIGNGTDTASLILCDCSADESASATTTTRYFYKDTSNGVVYYYCESATAPDSCSEETHTDSDHAAITGGVITGGELTDGYGAGVYVSSSATFEMTGGTIAGNYRRGTGGYGGGVFVYGTFIMSGGTIEGNRAYNGGGVAVSSNSNATFTMTGGEISSNTAINGGGVYVNGTFVMESGTIASNDVLDSNGYGGGVYVNGTFEMTDGSIESNTATNGGGVYVNGTFEMTDGSIESNTATNGGGVYVTSNGEFTMNGDEISSNSAGTGGGVYVNGGTFTMEDGKITLNEAISGGEGGGGVYTSGSATFTMEDGEISNNTAVDHGGGVRINSSGKFYMNGGSINNNSTQNDGGGIRVYNATFIMMGGTIAYNTAGGNGSLMRVESSATVAVYDGYLYGSISRAGGTISITGGYFSQDAYNSIYSNETSPYVPDYCTGEPVYDISNIVWKISAPEHDTHADGNIQFYLVTEAGVPLVGGVDEESMIYYYLYDDVELDNNITVTGYVTLCLNGNMLTGTGSGSVITVSSGASLTLCDCGADEGAENATVRYFYVGSNGLYTYCYNDTDGACGNNDHGNEPGDHVEITGGVITGGSTTSYGGGVYVIGTLKMYGGTIAGNYAGNRAGGVYMSDNATFEMYGGTLEGNYGRYGGGIWVSNGAMFTMEAGTISYNTSTEGGGVHVREGSATFTMNDGEITGNSATDMGGGVRIYGGTFIMNGGTIAGNTAGTNGGGVYANNQASFIMKSGEITGNKISGNDGGGVYVGSGTFTMEGGKITDNSAIYGGGVYVGSGQTFYMNGGEITNNTASTNGSEVFVYRSTFYMYVGTITDNNAGSIAGVHVSSNGDNGKFYMYGGTISASVTNTGTFTMEGETAEVYNLVNDGTVYMYSGSIKESLENSGSGTFYMYGGYLYATDVTNNGAMTITGGYLSSDAFIVVGDCIATDSGCTVTEVEGITGIAKQVTVESHDHDGTQFKYIVTVNGGSLYGGDSDENMVYYYLAADIEPTTNIFIYGYVTLCLNGHMLTGTGSGSVITVSSGASLTLCDCATATDEAAATATTRYFSVDSSTGLYTYCYNETGACNDQDSHQGTHKDITGGVITGGSTSNGGGVYVNSGATFVMKSGAIAGNYASEYGGGVYIIGGGTFEMRGGAITGNTANSAGGVFLNSNATFYMYDGEISYNSATSGEAGGIRANSSSKFYMYGGKITNNTTSSTGGGLRVYYATFEMYDGTIADNTAGVGYSNLIAAISNAKVTIYGGYFGGDIYVSGSTVSIYGGSFSDESNSGYLAAGYELKDSGNLGDEFRYAVVVIAHGHISETFDKLITPLGGEFAGGNQDNIVYYYLAEDISADITITEGYVTICLNGCTLSGNITVSGSATLTLCDCGSGEITGSITIDTDGTLVVTGGYLSGSIAGDGTFEMTGGYISDTVYDGSYIAYGYTLVKMGGGWYAVLPSDKVPHTHSETEYDYVLTSLGGTLEGGASDEEMVYYYLYDDVTLKTNITITGYVTLCLNGHVLTGTGSGSVITVSSGAYFVLCDCNDSDNEYYFYVDDSNSGLYTYCKDYNGGECSNGDHGNGDHKKITSGVITGGSTSNGGGVYVNSNATFVMESGSISGNTASSNGGGVYVTGTFYMEGGIISGNTANYGGGVQVASSATFYMNGGSTITDNYANYGGGGVNVDSSTFYMNSGTISDNIVAVPLNKSRLGGGGVRVRGGTFYMYSGTISYNKVLYSDGTLPEKIDEDNIDTYYYHGGGGVLVDYGTFYMEGGTIVSNESSAMGGGVFLVYRTSFTMEGGTIANNTAPEGGGSAIGARWHGNYVYFNMYGGYIDGSAYLGLTAAAIYGGYLSEEFYSDASSRVQYIAVNISLLGTDYDEGYVEGYPYAVYTVSSTEYTVSADGVTYGSSIAPVISDDTYDHVIYEWTDKDGEVNRGKEDTLPEDAGTYDITAYFLTKDDNGVIFAYSYSFTVEIAPANYEEALNLSENTVIDADCRVQTLDDINLNDRYSSDKGIWSWENSDTVISAGGTYEDITAVFTTTDGNYTAEVTVTVKVAAHDFVSGSWGSDDEYHWKKCAYCDATDDSELHDDVSSWTDDGDGYHYGTCETCGGQAKETHSYNYDAEPEWRWDETSYTATATFKCSKCDDTQDVTAAVTSSTNAATCTANGTTTYTATVTVTGSTDEKTYTDSKEVNIPATGHSYTDGKCTICGADEPDEGEESGTGDTGTTGESGTGDTGTGDTGTGTTDGDGSSGGSTGGTTEDGETKDGLSGGAIAGIVIGSTFGTLILAYAVCGILFKKGIVTAAFLSKIYPFIK